MIDHIFGGKIQTFLIIGADGHFTLYEDDSETCSYENSVCVSTDMDYSEGDTAVFNIHGAKGQLELVPDKRSYVFEFAGYEADAVKEVKVFAGNKAAEAELSYNKQKKAVVVMIPTVDVTEEIQISLPAGCKTKENAVTERCFDFLNQAEISFVLKDQLYTLIKSGKSVPVLLTEMISMNLDKDLYGAISEMLTALN